MVALSVILAVASLETTLLGACSEELTHQLKFEGIELSSRRVEPVVEGDVKRTLLIRQAGEVVLRRELGAGNCEQIARAAVVVLKRWLTGLGQIQVVQQTQSQETKSPADLEPRVTPTLRTPPTSKEPSPRQTPSEEHVEMGNKEESSSFPIPPLVVDPSVAKAPAPVELRSNEPALKTDAPPREAPVSQPDTAPEPPAERLLETPPPLVTKEDVAVSRPRPLRVDVTRWEVLAGGGLVTPATFGALTPLVSLDLSLILNQRIRALVWGAFDFGGSAPVIDENNNNRGTMRYLGAYVLPGAMICTQGVFRVCGGLNLGTKIVRAEASGAYVFQTRAAASGEFVVAPAIQLASFLGPFQLALDGSFMLTPVPATFSLDGLAAMASPRFQGLFRLSVGYGSK